MSTVNEQSVLPPTGKKVSVTEISNIENRLPKTNSSPFTIFKYVPYIVTLSAPLYRSKQTRVIYQEQ